MINKNIIKKLFNYMPSKKLSIQNDFYDLTVIIKKIIDEKKNNFNIMFDVNDYWFYL